jgi:hypothetical protein
MMLCFRQLPFSASTNCVCPPLSLSTAQFQQSFVSAAPALRTRDTKTTSLIHSVISAMAITQHFVLLEVKAMNPPGRYSRGKNIGRRNIHYQFFYNLNLKIYSRPKFQNVGNFHDKTMTP